MPLGRLHAALRAVLDGQIDAETLKVDDDEEDGTDDEIAPFPLTFTTPADLMWKLQKAEIIIRGPYAKLYQFISVLEG